MREWATILYILASLLAGDGIHKHKLHTGEAQCDTDAHCALLCKGQSGCDGGPQPGEAKP